MSLVPLVGSGRQGIEVRLIATFLILVILLLFLFGAFSRLFFV